MSTVGLGFGAVVQSRGFGELDGEIAECFVDFEDFRAVDALWVFIGGVRALRDVAGGEIGGDLAGVKFVLEGYLDGVFGEGYVGDGTMFGIYASDSGDHEVGLGEVEEGRVDES